MDLLRQSVNKLLEAFGDMARLSPKAEKAFLSTLEKRQVTKKELLQKEGTICNDVYFVEVGIARTFYYRDGKDITYWIAAENELVGPMGSFFSRKPSNKLVETLEDCILWVFNCGCNKYFFNSRLQPCCEISQFCNLTLLIPQRIYRICKSRLD